MFAIEYLSPPNPNSFLSFLALHAGDTGSILSGEDLLDKEMATHSSIHAREIP